MLECAGYEILEYEITNGFGMLIPDVFDTLMLKIIAKFEVSERKIDQRLDFFNEPERM